MLPPEGTTISLLVRKFLICAAIYIWITDDFESDVILSISDADMSSINPTFQIASVLLECFRNPGS